MQIDRYTDLESFFKQWSFLVGFRVVLYDSYQKFEPAEIIWKIRIFFALLLSIWKVKRNVLLTTFSSHLVDDTLMQRSTIAPFWDFCPKWH